jgi:hypothetical protein
MNYFLFETRTQLVLPDQGLKLEQECIAAINVA